MAPSEVSEISSRRMVVHSDGQRIKVEYVLRGDPRGLPEHERRVGVVQNPSET